MVGLYPSPARCGILGACGAHGADGGSISDRDAGRSRLSPAVLGASDALRSPEPVTPETHERRCPSCQSEKIVHAGQVVGGEGLIKSEHRCEGCGTEFWFVRTRVPRLPPPSGEVG